MTERETNEPEFNIVDNKTVAAERFHERAGETQQIISQIWMIVLSL